jgi:hypothetical protein
VSNPPSTAGFGGVRSIKRAYGIGALVVHHDLLHQAADVPPFLLRLHREQRGRDLSACDVHIALEDMEERPFTPPPLSQDEIATAWQEAGEAWDASTQKALQHDRGQTLLWPAMAPASSWTTTP